MALACAKLEYLNPCGSVKDRTVLAMIEAAEQDGSLGPGGTIVETTGGNTGIALAIMGSQRGYEVVIVCKDRMPAEKIAILQALNATIVRAPSDAPLESPDHVLKIAERIAAEPPGAVFVDQILRCRSSGRRASHAPGTSVYLADLVHAVSVGE